MGKSSGAQKIRLKERALVIATRRLSEAIRVVCEGSSGPGSRWEIKLEVRPVKRGYSVWLYEDNELVELPRRWRKVGSGKQSLTWREAYRAVADNNDLRVFGDLWCDTRIYGVTGIPADIIRLAFVVDEDAPYNYRALGELLIGLSDDELLEFVSDGEIDPYAHLSDEQHSHSAFLRKLNELAAHLTTAGLIGRSLSQIKLQLDAVNESMLDDLIRLAATRADAIRRSHDDKSDSDLLVVSEPSISLHKTVIAQDNPAQYPRHENWRAISKEPLQAPIHEQIALIERWLSERQNEGGGAIGGDGSEWPIISWLLKSGGRPLSVVLAALSSHRPDKAELLAREVMRRGKREAYYFEGTKRMSVTQGVHGLHIHAEHVRLALEFQEAADALKISFDEAYRIGELPYAPRRPDGASIFGGNR